MAVWMITGTGSGIGASITREVLARHGSVLATARRAADLAPLASLPNDRLHSAEVDITSPAQITRAFEACLSAFGRIDVLCCCAGRGLLAPLEETSDQQFLSALDVNFLGPMRLIRAALPTFRAQQSGHIIVVSAVAALANHEGFAAYGGAKAALEAACEALHAEVRPLGVRVTIVAPGPTRTKFISRSLDTPATTIADYLPTVGRFHKLLAGMDGKQPGDPDRLARLMADLAEMPDPPLRVVTGKYARARARAKIRTLGSELDAFEATAAAIDGTP